mmetsp:Transcript_2960/g.7999  ORF Transcript_2960/g.7999 Transcript_2960/m.7999 type:complete len:318 (+) Transcript_2960:2040-2993(+)
MEVQHFLQRLVFPMNVLEVRQSILVHGVQVHAKRDGVVVEPVRVPHQEPPGRKVGQVLHGEEPAPCFPLDCAAKLPHQLPVELGQWLAVNRGELEPPGCRGADLQVLLPLKQVCHPRFSVVLAQTAPTSRQVAIEAAPERGLPVANRGSELPSSVYVVVMQLVFLLAIKGLVEIELGARSVSKRRAAALVIVPHVQPLDEQLLVGLELSEQRKQDRHVVHVDLEDLVPQHPVDQLQLLVHDELSPLELRRAHARVQVEHGGEQDECSARGKPSLPLPLPPPAEPSLPHLLQQVVARHHSEARPLNLFTHAHLSSKWL